jgi:hypothetical protein
MAAPLVISMFNPALAAALDMRKYCRHGFDAPKG